jgi:hypothetical protein
VKKILVLVVLLMVVSGITFGQTKNMEEYTQEINQRNEMYTAFNRAGGFRTYISQGQDAVFTEYQRQYENLVALSGIYNSPDYLKYVVNPPALQYWKEMLDLMFASLDRQYLIAVSNLEG